MHHLTLTTSQTFNWTFWCSLGFSLATAVASLFFVYRAIRPPTKRTRFSFRNVFVLPCFVLLVFLSWIFAMVFVIGSIGLADMCYDSPDDNFKALMARMQSSFSPLIYQSIIYYVSGKTGLFQHWSSILTNKFLETFPHISETPLSWCKRLSG